MAKPVGSLRGKGSFPEEKVVRVEAGRIPQWLDVVPKELLGMRGREEQRESREGAEEVATV